MQSALGGPGLNLGLQDAANLGWKLAAVIRGEVPPDLLDTYETERRIAAEVAITVSRAQFALSRPGPEATAMCQIMAELATQPQVAQRLAQDISLGDIRYPTEPDAHPAVGQWVPDLPLTTVNGVIRIAQLCHDGRPLLLDFTAGDDIADAALGGGAAINGVCPRYARGKHRAESDLVAPQRLRGLGLLGIRSRYQVLRPHATPVVRPQPLARDNLTNYWLVIPLITQL